MKHKVENVGGGSFIYRGVMFTRDDRLRGYSGHYYTGRVLGLSAPTRTKLLAMIDNHFSKKEPR